MFFYTFLPKLLNMSLTAGVAIVFVLLLRLPLKKAPKVLSYALWGVVLFRLLCPVSVESGLSLFGLLNAPSAAGGGLTSRIEYIPSDLVHTEYPSVVLPVPGAGEAVSDALPQGEEQLTADPLEAPAAIATYVWMAGVLGMGLYAAISCARLRTKLVTASHLKENLYLADEIASPFVFGLLRPKIYLPSSLEERELTYIVMHEQHHIRRLDHIAKALAFIALSIHWFNPLVWIAFAASAKDMEMSCDEAVVRKMGDGVRADYAASLLNLAAGKHIVAGMPPAFGEGDVQERIRNLAKRKKLKRAAWAIVCLLVAASAVILGSNPSAVRLSKLKIDEVDMRAALTDVHSVTVQYRNDAAVCNEETADRLMDAIDKIQVRKKPVSESRAEDRSRSFAVVINNSLQLYFNEDFSELWFDNGIKPSFTYSIINRESVKEWMMDIYSALNLDETTVAEWFDYGSSGTMQWDGRQEICLDAFPGVTFRWTPERVEAVLEDGEILPLYTGMPIWNVFFADLTGDGLPELCSTLTVGSGVGDNRIILYDYANGASYLLESRMEYDYSLSLEDGLLVVTKRAFSNKKDGEILERGYLAYQDGAVRMVPLRAGSAPAAF